MQRRKGKIYPFKCRVPKNSKERLKGKKKKLSSVIKAKKLKKKKKRMGKTRDLFKKIRDTRNISCKNGHNKGQKWYGPNRNRRY